MNPRRTFLKQAVGAAAAACLPTTAPAAQDPKRRLKVAAIYTACTPRSHAHVILENFLEPCLFNGEWTDPGMDVVSLWGDQEPPGDLARAAAKEYGVRMCGNIREALTLGGKDLAVDAVLCIGEHGRYPMNERGQVEYPRKRFFDGCVEVFRETGKVVPIFNDKHLSYRWDWAKEMYDTARAMKIPFMAGSSVPLAQRRPSLEVPSGAEIEEAVSFHGGGFEGYDFHALEVLQAMLEARKGGETGVARVQFLSGEALWKAAEAGRWSEAVAEAAREADLGKDRPRLREIPQRRMQFRGPQSPWGILVEYRDGTRGTALRFDRSGTRWPFACRVKGEKTPLATSFYVGPWDNRCLFKALSHAIQAHFRNREAPYPIERTLLTTGILEAAVTSHHEGDRVVETPHLNIAYQPRDYRAYRENGASWKVLPEDTPQPPGIDKARERQKKPAQ